MAHIGAGESCAVGSSEVLLFQMSPHFVSHLEFLWQPMLIMLLLVLRIGYVQYVMRLSANVLNAQNEFVCLVCLRLDMG
jgi:hypothetical protein